MPNGLSSEEVIDAGKDADFIIADAMAVAEQAVLLILGLLRDVTGGDRAVREGRQITVKENYTLMGFFSNILQGDSEIFQSDIFLA